ncbi:hypothetical protein GCM10010149_76950 [Nonomuraea roseoviolacea subsp. roseoviolacea]|uniref:Membrane-bound spermidine synthase n=1 Tax=Nonomuraea roseoviolacea subsp. carminata TaxID=160689 RepID=A0ABT1KAW4_9ACTN|nr:hypothetical protein [Nonomuraea roseoviolacea]MCP2350754.1 putative membrane-bound spermidine synthase [Nonomuraea roseoviolacea subsp. carminata]
MTAVTVTTDRTKFLRLALAADAAVTGVNGLAYLAAAGPLADLLGPGAGLLRGIGAFLLVYAVAVGVLATRPVNAAATKAVIAVNLAWTLASLVAAVADSAEFTVLGLVWTVAQALVVAVFAELQIMGLRRAR